MTARTLWSEHCNMHGGLEPPTPGCVSTVHTKHLPLTAVGDQISAFWRINPEICCIYLTFSCWRITRSLTARGNDTSFGIMKHFKELLHMKPLQSQLNNPKQMHGSWQLTFWRREKTRFALHNRCQWEPRQKTLILLYIHTFILGPNQTWRFFFFFHFKVVQRIWFLTTVVKVVKRLIFTSLESNSDIKPPAWRLRSISRLIQWARALIGAGVIT